MQNAAVQNGEDIRAGENRADVRPAAGVCHPKGVRANTVSKAAGLDEARRRYLAIHQRVRLPVR